MNALVGAATALIMWSTGVGDPILWGTLAFLLNYVPMLGPACATVIFLFAGSLTIPSMWLALLPAALYSAIHLIEGETVRRCFSPGDLRSILFSWSSLSCSGCGCGASPARSFRRRFWPHQNRM
jgi:hypothetical protein